jgi:hypothetical protein
MVLGVQQCTQPFFLKLALALLQSAPGYEPLNFASDAVIVPFLKATRAPRHESRQQGRRSVNNQSLNRASGSVPS